MDHGQPFTFEEPPRFQPDRMFRSGHAQTIVPFFMRNAAENYTALPHHITLDDGDVIVMHDDCPPSWLPGSRVVVLVHGLGGCHASTYMARIAERLRGLGIRVFRLDMRGCGAGLHLAKGVFHAARSRDLLQAVIYVQSLCSESSVTVCGFSLGANLTLKMLGNDGCEFIPQVDSAIVVEPPIDLYYCCCKLKLGLGWMYDGFLAQTLWRDFSQRIDGIPGSDRLRIPRRPRTLFEFDTHITSHLAGFDSAEEYYETASSKDVLPRIRVPVAVLTAADDPIVPVDVFDGAHWSSTTQFFIADGGGHLGFIGNSPGFDQPGTRNRWMDACILHWIRSLPNSSALPKMPIPVATSLDRQNV